MRMTGQHPGTGVQRHHESSQVPLMWVEPDQIWPPRQRLLQETEEGLPHSADLEDRLVGIWLRQGQKVQYGPDWKIFRNHSSPIAF